MNELKSDNNIVRNDRNNGGTASNVSTFVKREEKTYVRRYSMTKKKVSKWIDNNYNADAYSLTHPSTRQFKAEEATSDPARRAKAKILIACVGLALVMLMIIPAIKLISAYLVIEEIRVEGETFYSEDELLSAAGLDMGAGLPLLKAGQAEAAVLNNLPYVQSCEISFELPNVIVFDLVDETPAFYSEIEGEKYILTSSMIVLERTDDESMLYGLPFVELPRISKAVVGEELVLEETSIDYIAEFFRLLNKSDLNGRVGRIYFDKKFDIVASVDGKFRVLWGSPNDMELKFATVSKMIEENGDACLTAGIIDVRVANVSGIILDANIDPEVRE